MKGYIYEINIGDKKYVGSTKMRLLCNRQSAHNRDLKANIKQSPLFEECRKQNINKATITEKEQRITKNNRQIKYYNRNKEEKNKIIHCDCGGTYTKRNITIHLKTQKHINYINNK